MSTRRSTSCDQGMTLGGEQHPMTIGELAGITGVSVSAIRFYQRRGLLPGRDAETGWQRFGFDAVDRLAVIELCKSAGFTLDETGRVLDALGGAVPLDANGEPIWRGLAEAKIAEVDARILRLRQMRGLLQDALAHGGLSADRVRQVPAALGWAIVDEHATILRPAGVPASTA